jgi:hypothetical protein
MPRMSVFDHVFNRALNLVHPPRRGQRVRATLESRLALLETEVSELETLCKTLVGVIRDAKVMSDDRVEALLKQTAQQAGKARDLAGERLEQRPPM